MTGTGYFYYLFSESRWQVRSGTKRDIRSPHQRSTELVSKLLRFAALRHRICWNPIESGKVPLNLGGTAGLTSAPSMIVWGGFFIFYQTKEENADGLRDCFGSGTN